MNTLPAIKASLIEGLDTRRARAEALIEQVSPELRVHPDSDWTARDLITHLTAFEEDMVDAIQTFLDNKKYRLDLRGQIDIAAFNEVRRQERAHKSWEQALGEWKNVRDQLRGVIIAFPASQLEIPFNTPFLQKYTLMQAIRGCGVHEKIHIGEIVAAITSQTDA